MVAVLGAAVLFVRPSGSDSDSATTASVNSEREPGPSDNSTLQPSQRDDSRRERTQHNAAPDDAADDDVSTVLGAAQPAPTAAPEPVATAQPPADPTVLAADKFSSRIRRPDCRDARDAPTPLVAPSEIPGVARTIGPLYGPGTDSVAPLHGRWLRDIAVLDDGRVASVTFDDEFMIWDPARPFDPPRYSEPHHDTLWEIAAGAGSLVIVADANGQVLIYDANNPEEPMETFDWYDDWPMTVSVMCDGRMIVANDSPVITIWDPYARERTTLQDPDDHVRAVLELSDGRLVTTSLYRFVRIWDLDNPTEPVTLPADFESFPGQIVELDNGLIAITDNTERVRVWDPNDGRLVGGREQVGEGDEPQNIVIAAAPGGLLVITTSGGGAVVWEPTTDQLQVLAPGEIPDDAELYFDDDLVEIAVTPNGDVVSSSLNSLNRIWRLGDDFENWTPGLVLEPVLVTSTFPASRLGDRLTVLDDGRLLSTTALGLRISDVNTFVEDHTTADVITAVAWSDGGIGDDLVIGAADGSITVHGADGTSTGFVAPFGPVSATASADGLLYAAAPNPDATGSSLTVARPDGTAIGSGTTTDEVTTLTYMHASRTLLAGTTNGNILRVDTAGNATSVASLDDTAVVQILELSADRAAISTDASAIWILDLSTGAIQEQAHPFGPPAPMMVAQNQLYTSSGAGKVRVFELADLSADPVVVDTGNPWAPIALLPVDGRVNAFGYIDAGASLSVLDLEGNSKPGADLGVYLQRATLNPITGQLAVATQTGVAVLEAAPALASPPAQDPENPGLAGLPGPTWLSNAHQLSDGTLVGIGSDDAGPAIWTWPAGSLQDPTRTPFADLSSVSASAIVDDSWLIFAATNPWDPESDDELTSRLEYWDLDALEEGVQYVEQGSYFSTLQATSGGRFYASTNSPDAVFDLTLRTVEDFDDITVVSQGSYTSQIMVLRDGWIAIDGIELRNPQEPERAAVNVPQTFYARNFAELADGRIIWGQQGAWGIHDRVTGESVVFTISNTDVYVTARVLSDGHVAINGGAGIEIYDLSDPETLVALYASPDGEDVSSTYLTYTDTHAVSFGGTNGQLWVWELASPDAPATQFAGGEPVIALDEGRIVSNSESGLLVWDPASVILDAP